MKFNASYEFAYSLDQEDPLAHVRDKFHIPKTSKGDDVIYFCGNSLGLQPKNVASYMERELLDWQELGVEGHFKAKRPWMPYHELFNESLAKLVGCLPSEVVIMNSLTVNLHLMLVSFYRPTAKRFKILVEYSPFPSDRYALVSHAKFRGYDPDKVLIELKPSVDSELVSHDSIEEVLQTQGEEIALVMLGGLNYYTGQAYPLKKITELAHSKGIIVGYDLAHAAGNIPLKLHEDGTDFAVWCNYKYLNGGPGCVGASFIHERHANNENIHRFAGWWGNDKSLRFKMMDRFVPIEGAEGWQISNPPIFSMAPLRASLDIFDDIGMSPLVRKSKQLTSYLEFLIRNIKHPNINIITPGDPESRGCQLSVQIKNKNQQLFKKLLAKNIIADWREPDVIRVAPVPLYNSYTEAWKFAEALRSVLNTS